MSSYYMPKASDFRLSRKWTSAIIDAMDAGELDPRAVADMCLGALSEADVKLMCQSNDMCYLDPDREPDEDGEPE